MAKSLMQPSNSIYTDSDNWHNRTVLMNLPDKTNFSNCHEAKHKINNTKLVQKSHLYSSELFVLILTHPVGMQNTDWVKKHWRYRCNKFTQNYMPSMLQEIGQFKLLVEYDKKNHYMRVCNQRCKLLKYNSTKPIQKY